MRLYLTIWWRAFSIVTVTALNVTEISHFHPLTAFFTGGLLSYIWWGNSQKASVTIGVPGGAFAYGLGAACGTVTGMFLGRLVA